MPASPAAVLEALPLAAVSLQRRRQQRATEPDYARDPVRWVSERLHEFLWSKQRAVMEAVRDHRRTAVPSAHAVGKSFVAARLVGWWLDTHAPGEAFVVTTAPTAVQVRNILWREINRVHARGVLPGRTNQTEWWLNEEIVAFGRKPADYSPTAFQGIHARAVLVIIDEAGGVPDTIYRAAASLAANEHSRILAIGNPDDSTAHFATICKPGAGWHVLPIDGLESPNFTDEDVPPDLRDYLISPLYVEELREDVGEDSAIFRSKARGQFSEDTEDGVVLLSWARACQALELPPVGPVELGVDVGAGGDETVVRERRGPVAGRTWRKKTPDWADGVALVLQAIADTGAERVKVDVIGIGWGLVGRLEELRQEGRHGAEILGVNVGAASRDPSKFPKLRDQLWWEIGRDLTRQRAWDLAAVDDKTLAQLVAPRYQRDSSNRIKIEPKADTRGRLGRSPDDADALLLAYYVPPAVGVAQPIGGSGVDLLRATRR